ncbi:unnamed protein product [Rotaria socialis]|uniref:Mpv17-like protein 2 n=2 Tax=Rotaria socialis TaxID=392032 RepID=A0A817UZ98_9BILA|nr:unnamed protein product [Rotaria socialis]CAF3333835.1 unnamed protein product [Rotaria socialis]CAF3704457.1 unnamed protein product [Rotaria socialis]CAF4222954.1 unnamed protein product [Rotaria socialis]CAF4315778.1 unnamed protein product [Rotaria socialis]
MMKSFFRRYQLFIVNIVSASGLLATSDLFVQILYEKRETIDKKRFLAALGTGAVMGVEGHIWYSYIDRVMAQRTWRDVFKKVAIDQTIGAPFYALTYIVGTSILEDRTSSAELTSDIRKNFFPLYLADCLIFAPIQLINFKYVPAFYRVPFLSLAAFVFDAFISAYKHEEKPMTVPEQA